MIKRKQHKYTKKQRAFILENYKGRTTFELTAMINNAFNIKLKRSQIREYLKNHKLNTGVDGKFRYGHTPFNAGTKGIMKANSGTFSKGHIPANHRNIGDERINIYGYIEIKIAEPNKWALKHRLVYEEANGSIPKGYAIFFLDGDKTNLKLDNMTLVSRRELLVINKNKLYSSKKEITESGVTLAKVMVALYKKRRKYEQR